MSLLDKIQFLRNVVPHLIEILRVIIKCLEHPDDGYYQSFLKAGNNVYDYTGFLEELYKNYYKDEK